MGALFQSTASASTAVAQSGGDLRTQSDLTEYINVYYNELWTNFSGDINESRLVGMFRERGQKNDAEVVLTKVQGSDAAGINEDGEDLEYISWGQGWSYTFSVYPYRIAVKHTRHLEEIENFGEITQEADELMNSGKRTIKWALADVFNRGIAPTNAPFLCLDGMYLIDGDAAGTARVNPVVGVQGWTNEETTGDLTEDLLFTAEDNAGNTKAANGDDLELGIKHIYIPTGYEQVMWKINNTPGTVDTATHERNWAHSRFTYSTVREFTGNTIFYALGNPKSSDNGLELRWAVRPNVADVNFEDPDILGTRLRFRFGIGCLDPRKMWRGGMLNAL